MVLIIAVLSPELASKVINLVQNIDLSEKSRTFKKYKKIFQNIKIGKEILTFGNIESKKKKTPLLKSPIFKRLRD